LINIIQISFEETLSFKIGNLKIIKEEIKEQVIENSEINSMEGGSVEPTSETLTNSQNSQNSQNTKISFNDIDLVKDYSNKEEQIMAPKTIDRLEMISEQRNNQRKIESADDENENIKLNISDENIELDNLDVHIINEPELEMLPDLIIDDIEVLE
jgi:hypothetical protein